MGEQLERWAREVMRGDPTVNSGATYEDADMKVDGVGGRVYEFKSSKVNDGLSLRRDHVMVLLQRGIKLNRQPVFIYQNKSGFKLAVVPLKVLSETIGKWDEHHYTSEEVNAVKHAYSTAPRINAKGNNIRISEEDLKTAMALNGLMIYQTKNTVAWVIMEAMPWLKIAGDLKRKNNGNGKREASEDSLDAEGNAV